MVIEPGLGFLRVIVGIMHTEIASGTYSHSFPLIEYTIPGESVQLPYSPPEDRLPSFPVSIPELVKVSFEDICILRGDDETASRYLCVGTVSRCRCSKARWLLIFSGR